MSAPTALSRHRHSPLVRRLARENGLDPDLLRGTGPVGRVTPADVLKVAASSASVTARRVPCHTHVIEVDLTRVLDRHDGAAWNLASTAVLAKAVLESLQAHPLLNGNIGEDGRVVRRARQDLGVGFDTADEPVVLVLRDAGSLSLAGLTRRLGLLAEQAQAGQVEPADLTGASFTLSGTGNRGVLFDFPALLDSQLAVVSAGTPVDRPVVVRDDNRRGAIAIRSMAYIALTHHQVIGRAAAAAFQLTLKTKLEAGMFR